MLTLKLRYKEPDGDKSKLIEVPVRASTGAFEKASDNFRFAASVAGFGMLLRDSANKGSLTLDRLLEVAESSKGNDPHATARNSSVWSRRLERLQIWKRWNVNWSILLRQETERKSVLKKGSMYSAFSAVAFLPAELLVSCMRCFEALGHQNPAPATRMIVE